MNKAIRNTYILGIAFLLLGILVQKTYIPIFKFFGHTCGASFPPGAIPIVPINSLYCIFPETLSISLKFIGTVTLIVGLVRSIIKLCRKIRIHPFFGIAGFILIIVSGVFLYGVISKAIYMPAYLSDKQYCRKDSDCIVGCKEYINKYWYEKNKYLYDNNIPKEGCGGFSGWYTSTYNPECHENSCNSFSVPLY